MYGFCQNIQFTCIIDIIPQIHPSLDNYFKDFHVATQEAFDVFGIGTNSDLRFPIKRL